jgi:hypothetical protein
LFNILNTQHGHGIEWQIAEAMWYTAWLRTASSVGAPGITLLARQYND